MLAQAAWPRSRCRPLRFEQRTQAILRLRQRDARDDRLEEAEDDELARHVARHAAAHQVEDLGLVDRPDRARVGCTSDVGLVDLEAGDGHRARLLGQQHGELAQEAVGAVGRALDRDHALVVTARAIEENALATAGRRSCPRRCGACSWSRRTAAGHRRSRSRPGGRWSHDRRAGCRSGSWTVAPPTLASAQFSCASRSSVAWRLTIDSVLAPKSCWPAKPSCAPGARATSVVPHHRLWPSPAVRGRRHLLLEHLCSLAFSPRLSTVRVTGRGRARRRSSARRLAAPARPRRGRGSPGQAPRGCARTARTCRPRGSVAPPSMPSRSSSGCVAQHVRERVDNDPGGARLVHSSRAPRRGPRQPRSAPPRPPARVARLPPPSPRLAVRRRCHSSAPRAGRRTA